MTRRFDVVVIGAGAAGLMCAAIAGRRGRSVVVIEHSTQPGRKILISGGGRCNFTHLHTTPAHFVSSNPHFAKSALSRYTPADFVRLVERHGIPYHEKTAGQLFCDGSARAILEMLLNEVRRAGGEVWTGVPVNSVRKDERFELSLNTGAVSAESVVIATGGLSIPKAGATDFGYRMARQFGLTIEPTRPALVPLTLSPADPAFFQDLSGVSIDADVRCGSASFRDRVLWTHRGLSGPAILQISTFWSEGVPIELDLLPGIDAGEALHRDRHPLPILEEFTAQRFARRWSAAFAPGTPPLSNVELERVRERLHHWSITPSGTEGFAKAEVTAGGVSTAELSGQTMESVRVPGLYFIGEVVDVTGHLGGYNFQWAWSSAHAAGMAV